MGKLITVLVVARDAEKTLSRCLRSAFEQTDQVILVDDCSVDRTVDVALEEGLSPERLVRIREHVSLGHARQKGLEAVGTEFAMILDSDDELLPGRVARFEAAFESGGHDCLFDSLEICDGKTGAFIRQARVPEFLKQGRAFCRLFERNYLPGIGQAAFRTSVFREIGYDPALTGPEDSDIVFRGLLAGARFSVVPGVGYRMYHYEGSVSRNLERQNSQLQYVLRKHDYVAVARLFAIAGVPDRITAWGLHGFAMFRGDWEEAGSFLSDAVPQGSDLSIVLEPEGPEPIAEGWRLGFAKGVLAYLGQDYEAARKHFEQALEFERSADALNNLGVVVRCLGKEEESRAFFLEALFLNPSYLDAQFNRDSEASQRVTLRPLRRSAIREKY